MLSSEGVGAQHRGLEDARRLPLVSDDERIVVVDPRRRDTEPPRVMIEGITIDRETVPLGGGSGNRFD